MTAVALLLIAAAASAAAPAPDAAYRDEIRAYRAEREERLRREDGWLTLAGLFWLKPGDNAFGSDPGNPIVLPGKGTSPRAGVLAYDGKTVTLTAAPGAGITLDGKPVERRVLADDSGQAPDILKIGAVSFQVLARGGKHAVRVKDPASAARAGFRGLDHYPVDPAYRVLARYVPYAEPRKVAISTAVGTTEEMLVPGLLEFTLGGKTLTLQPLLENPDATEMFLIFRDQTSGQETYGAGRYLYANREGSSAVIDFNKAYNPPCAFTPFATCPLPPPGNRLDARVLAGEKAYGAPGAH